MTRTAAQHKRGFASIYLLVIFTALMGVASLAVDFGRVEVARSELQRAADAAARAGAAALDQDYNAVKSQARAFASANLADGTPVILKDQDIEIGIWKNNKFYKNGNPDDINAVRITAQRTSDRGNAIPLLLGRAVGPAFCDAKVVAIAMVHPRIEYTFSVPGTSDPYLAGMPPGTNASTTDYAGTTDDPKQSPLLVQGIPIIPGTTINFSFTGAVRNNPNYNNYDPDGNLSWILNHDNRAENGIADVRMPINALLGVFLNDDQPNRTAAPDGLDFSSDDSRDFDALSPKIKQPFFIGDGLNSAGRVQQFIVPPGATRLYLGTMDGFEWSNNMGGFETHVVRPEQIVLVK
jgi:hypothetical protein